MHEVDGLAIDIRRELIERVQSVFLRAPVEGCLPVLRDVFQVAERNAATPVIGARRLWPAGAGETGLQIVEVSRGNVDAEGTDLRVAAHTTQRNLQCGTFRSSLAVRYGAQA